MELNQNISGDNNSVYNANKMYHNILEDKLKYYGEKKFKQKPNCASKMNLIERIIDKDKLKSRFNNLDFKYEELVDKIEKVIENDADNDYLFNKDNLDDGYKSIISIILFFVKNLDTNEDNSTMYLGNELLIVSVTNFGLTISYSENIKDYTTYREVRKKAIAFKENCAPFLHCANRYGGFFQFHDININPLEDAPFLTEDVKFNVSNEIIPSLIKPLYGDSPECGLRELIQNATDATKELCYEKKYQLDEYKIEIDILYNDSVKQIRIRDFGIGMDKETLLSKYFVVGESSKKESDIGLVGQFGIGALAGFLLGDTVDLKTKRYDSDKIYQCSYTLNQSQNNNIQVNILNDESFVCGTEININFNESLIEKIENEESEESEESEILRQTLISLLKLDEWYLLPDVDIVCKINSEKVEIPSYKGDEYSWKEINVGIEGVEVSYLEYNRKREREREREIFAYFYDKKGKVIFNGIIVPNGYSLNNYMTTSDYPDYYHYFGSFTEYFKFNYYPVLSIKSKNSKIKLNLERSEFSTDIKEIIAVLKKELITQGIKQLKLEKDKIVKDGHIVNTVYHNDFLYEVPITFTNKGFRVITKNINEDFLEIRGSSNKIHLQELVDDKFYVFFNNKHSKSDLAYIIMKAQNYGISMKVINKYFYNATNQNNGFRIEAMKKIYNMIGEEADFSNARKFWKMHSKNRNKFKHKLDKYGDVFTDNEENRALFCELYNTCEFQIIRIKNEPDYKALDACYDTEILL